MAHEIKIDSTDVSLPVVLRNAVTGAPETGYTIADIDLYYWRQGETVAAKVDATALGSLNAAHSDNHAYEARAGSYRVDWPDAAFASGADWVILSVEGVGIDPAIELITLTVGDDQTLLDLYDRLFGKHVFHREAAYDTFHRVSDDSVMMHRKQTEGLDGSEHISTWDEYTP